MMKKSFKLTTVAVSLMMVSLISCKVLPGADQTSTAAAAASDSSSAIPCIQVKLAAAYGPNFTPGMLAPDAYSEDLMTGFGTAVHNSVVPFLRSQIIGKKPSNRDRAKRCVGVNCWLAYRVGSDPRLGAVRSRDLSLDLAHGGGQQPVWELYQPGSGTDVEIIDSSEQPADDGNGSSSGQNLFNSLIIPMRSYYLRRLGLSGAQNGERGPHKDKQPPRFG